MSVKLPVETRGNLEQANGQRLRVLPAEDRVREGGHVPVVDTGDLSSVQVPPAPSMI